ncbi:hypothetical protein LAWI1_G003144 [Lachnellula willkommii]|uniref:Uncharacterized protein n=1 Tax=Lachnellula willkommii TaxID=215461 RepID=A0A559MLZ9_9HELO|nr:hypothetical protein LAWI1_G003144 [Lachnellula willkommii]
MPEILMRREKTDQTKDEDYEIIENHTFDAVEYDRYMSWQAGEGNGLIIVGIRMLKTDTDEQNVVLRKGFSVTVKNVNFKLVK